MSRFGKREHEALVVSPPRSIRACRAIGNARKGPSSVRWVTFAIIAAHISRADNVLRNDSITDDLPQVGFRGDN